MSSAAIPINTCWRCGGILECTDETDELGRVIWDCPRCTREICDLERRAAARRFVTARRQGDRMTTGEVARLVGVSQQTVLNWIRAGLVPAERDGHFHFIRPLTASEVQALRSRKGKRWDR